MKKGNLILASMLISTMILSLSSCSEPAPADKTGTTTSGSSASSESEAKVPETVEPENISGFSQVIDIRTPDEFLGWKNQNGVSGHIEGAIDFPVSWFGYIKKAENIDIELKRRNIDKEKPVLLYSNDDVTPEEIKLFESNGFKSVSVLKGGINSYSQKGLKLTRLEGYKRYVSPKWVQDLIDGKNPETYEGKDYKIVEISLPSEIKKEEYSKNGHIKGAININSDDICHLPGLRTVQEYEGVPVEEQLKFWKFRPDSYIREVLEKNGITKDTTVILYASEAATTAANRAALVMDYAGVKDIRFINGGKVLWTLEGRPLDKENAELSKKDFGAEIPQKPGIVYTYEQELKFTEDTNAVIASVRSWDEYLGKISGYTYIDKAGDIRNSRFAYAGSNPYAMEDFRNPDNTMFNYELISHRWKLWGIVPEKTVSFHCGTGWRASETYYIAEAMGWKNIGVYVGGWYEWHKIPGSPVMEPGLPQDAPEKEPQEYFYKK